MNLITQAENDLSFTLEDVDNGFGVDVEISDPLGNVYQLTGQSTDVGMLIDPGTGIGVRGRTAEITFRLSTVLDVIGTIPDKDETGMGWILKVRNVNGDEWTFGITVADVDRKIGLVRVALELLEIE